MTPLVSDVFCVLSCRAAGVLLQPNAEDPSTAPVQHQEGHRFRAHGEGGGGQKERKKPWPFQQSFVNTLMFAKAPRPFCWQQHNLSLCPSCPATQSISSSVNLFLTLKPLSVQPEWAPPPPPSLFLCCLWCSSNWPEASAPSPGCSVFSVLSLSASPPHYFDPCLTKTETNFTSLETFWSCFLFPRHVGAVVKCPVVNVMFVRPEAAFI